jgi:hypothetical protein
MLYCILRSPTQPLPLPSGLREIHAEGFAAVVADADPARVRSADRPALQGYANLIADLHGMADLIPMRYGCLLESDDAILRLLHLRHSRLNVLLDRLDGCTELGLRLLLPTPDVNEAVVEHESGNARPGHTHLAKVRRQFQAEARVVEQAKAVRTTIERSLTGLFRDTFQELGQIEGRQLLSLYYLVPRSTCNDFVEALRRAPNPFPEPMMDHCLVSGPWPPYNFVGVIDNDLRYLA